MFGWLIFRSESVEQILAFSYALLDLSQLELSIPLTTIAVLAFAVLGIDLWLEYSHRINSKPSPFRTAIARQSAIGLYSLLIGAIFLLGSRGGGEFIYFQF
jgi:hypothetical protein